MTITDCKTNYIKKRRNSKDEEEKKGQDELEEELLEGLEEDFELIGMREKRMEELRQEFIKRQQMEEDHHGKYLQIKNEKEVIQITAKSKFAVVHFFHGDFRRCKIMDNHLESIATRYFATRFLRVDVADVPWLVNKLEIKVLPCVFVFLDGVTKDRIIGFEGLTEEGTDGFSTASLELRLKQSVQTMLMILKGVLPVESTPGSTSGPRVRVSPSVKIMQDDDDWDG
ncbi:thioredoxin-like protein [Melampsora americana]|nr:thioredoxin-like protein [Melampsora americana]